MRSWKDGFRHLRFGVLGLGVLCAIASPAQAEWTPTPGLPLTTFFSVWANGDTLAAGADTAVYVSTNAGASWKRSAKVVAGAVAIEAVWVRGGRLYAGTFGQGAFISDDLGTTWHAFNEGLVGGFLDSQLDLVDLQVRGDDIYAATAGAGAYERSLIGVATWHPFGAVFEPNQAPNLNSLALGGNRLLAAAGSNGAVFVRDPDDAEWTLSNLDNVGIHAGLQAQTAAWTGTGWVVGTNLGLFLSPLGQEPWTRLNLGLGPVNWSTFATKDGHLFGAFDITNAAVIEDSGDDGATWQNLEVLPDVFVSRLAISRSVLYAARADGLWFNPIPVLSVPGDARGAGLRFALAGPQPCRDQVRLRFDLPQPGSASIELFDILGRVTGGRIESTWSAGPHVVSLDARGLAPGVYCALLETRGAHEAIRLVHVR